MGIQIPYSAFRATNVTATQPVGGQVLFPDEVFDLNDEYDETTSTFSPNQGGVYLIVASVLFEKNPEVALTDYVVEVDVLVNGADPEKAFADNEYVPESLSAEVVAVKASSIVQLEAGDEVTVSAFASVDGEILNNPYGTLFEAARFPSPIVNDNSSTLNVSNKQLPLIQS